jgi:GNAT superfamily N-acetyltransferase
MPPACTISDLRQRPEFFDAVAERIWQAWWKVEGHPLAYIATRLKENLDAAPIPFALVAHREAEFLGTASVIKSDLAERPQYTPWVAAVWVDPAFRGSGVGAALVERAAQGCFALGIGRAYLCARPERCSFYTGQGWVTIEQGIGDKRLSVLVRDASA